MSKYYYVFKFQVWKKVEIAKTKSKFKKASWKSAESVEKAMRRRKMYFTWWDIH